MAQRGPVPTRVIAARDAINRLSVRGLSARELLTRVAERLGRVIPYHTRSWSPFDPETMLPMDVVNPTAPARLLTRLFDNEFFTPDFAKFADIARRRRPVLTLWEATGGDLRRSPRHRCIHRPLVEVGRPECAVGLGFMLPSADRPLGGPGSFGHPGMGGSRAWALPERDLAFGYVVNRLRDTTPEPDPREVALSDAVLASVPLS